MKTFKQLLKACEKFSIGAEKFSETSFIFYSPYTADEYCVVYHNPSDYGSYYTLHLEEKEHFEIAGCKKAKTMFKIIKNLNNAWYEV